MMHPFEFGGGNYTFEMLQNLIDKLQMSGYTSANFHTIISETKNQKLTNIPASKDLEIYKASSFKNLCHKCLYNKASRLFLTSNLTCNVQSNSNVLI